MRSTLWTKLMGKYIGLSPQVIDSSLVNDPGEVINLCVIINHFTKSHR